MNGKSGSAAPDERCEFAAAGARWTVTGVLTFASAENALASAKGLPLPSSGVVDCSGISAVDSAAVAVLLAILRRAETERTALTFSGIPPALAALAALYGVDAFIAG